MRVVFLYTELAAYFVKCCETLSISADVHVVRWPVNSEAPFSFKFSEKIKVYDKSAYSRDGLKKLLVQIGPDMIICSGWIDKDYLSVTSDYAGKIPTVMTCDTHWRGSIKQWLAVFMSRFYLLPKFSHAWVPGKIQQQYVRRLGFREQNIKMGFYSCDLDKFNASFRSIDPRERSSKKRFLYVGRYYDFKGITDLWEAFVEFDKTSKKDWELWCLGTGDISPLQHPRIRHFGFVQPDALEPIINACSVFVLPSRFEPWGVVVHEYAASGFPMILSEAVGAKSAFLSEGANGFVFEPGNVAELTDCLKKMSDISEKELNSMSIKSHELAQQISPNTWASTVMEFYNEGKKK